MPIFARVFRVHREGRTGNAVRRMGKRLRQAIFRSDELVVFRYARESGVPDREELDFGDFRDLEEFAAAHPQIYDQAQMEYARERRAAGDRIYALRVDGQLAQVSWVRIATQIAPREVAPQCRIAIDRPAAIVNDCWTPASFRGRGLYPRVLRAIVADMHEAGMDTWIYCYRDNVPSIRGIEKAGFQLHSRMRRTRLLSLVSFSRTTLEAKPAYPSGRPGDRADDTPRAAGAGTSEARPG